jgi:hypothetical protein
MTLMKMILAVITTTLDSIDFDISAEEIKAMNWFLGKTK